MNFAQLSKVKFIKLTAVLFFSLSFSGFATAQDAPVNPDSIYSVVETMPIFPGGEKAMLTYILKNIKYPSDAQKNKLEGKVILQFVVDKSGKVKNAKIIRGIAPSLDKEALRVVKSFPVWTPGEQGGQKVAVFQTIPVSFKWEPLLTDSAGWRVNEKTLVIIDGVNMPKNFNTDILSPSKLTSAIALKPFPKEEKQKLIEKYGKQATDGVLLITTNKYEMYYAMADSSTCTEEASIPTYKAGNEQLVKYIADSIHYPFVPLQMKREGKVFVRFRVDKTGKVCDVKVLKSLEHFLDKEAVRVVSTLPDWNPGSQCKTNIDIIVTMPVTFRLPLSDTEKPVWKVNDKTIIILDGQRLPSVFNLDLLNYVNLASYKVLEPSTPEITKKLVSKYGKDAVNGVVLISTKVSK